MTSAPLADAPAPAAPSPADAEPALVVENVTRTYRASGREPARAALDGVSLTLRRGEWLTLLGPNGSGKSTLLRLIATLESPQSGTVTILSERASGAAAMRALRARLGVVFQKPALDSLLTVRENLMLQASLLGVTRGAADDRVRTVASALGFLDRMSSRVSTLSGGLARRVDIARALLCEPELLLLDEPSAGLDLDSRSALLDLIDQRRGASLKPLTVVLSTHLMDEAERGTRVALLHAGKIIAEGRPADLRRALGGRVVCVPTASAAILESSGLTLTRTTPEAVGTGSAEAVERAVLTLTREGVAFTVGPPTLADVYFAHTGARLAEGTA